MNCENLHHQPSERHALGEPCPAEARARAENAPHIALGRGLVEVAEGSYAGCLALIFGRHGTGVVGEATQPNREHEPGETLAVVTFENVASLDVVAEKLAILRSKLIAAGAAQ